jgi:hypothetical protein
MRRFASWLLLLVWLPWQWSIASAAGADCAHPGDRAAAVHATDVAPPPVGMPVADTPHRNHHAAHSVDSTIDVDASSAPHVSAPDETLVAGEVVPDCTHAHCTACCHGAAAAVLPAAAAQSPFAPAAGARAGAAQVLDLSGGFDGPFRPPRPAAA